MRGEPRAPPPSSSPMVEGDTLIPVAKKVYEGFDETLSGTVRGESAVCRGDAVDGCVCPDVKVFLFGAVSPGDGQASALLLTAAEKGSS